MFGMIPNLDMVKVKMGNLKFNYSYSRYTLAANTSLFGLTIDFANDR